LEVHELREKETEGGERKRRGRRERGGKRDVVLDN